MAKFAWRSALALFFVLVVTLSARAGADWQSTALGKATVVNVLAGGFDFGHSSCPDGKYVVGLEIRSGTLIDAMRVECAKLGPNGEHQDRTVGFTIGNELGGNVGLMRCPAGQVVTAVRARAGEFIDQVSFACRSWNATQGLHGSLRWQPAHGGSGGEPVGPVECPDDMAMTHLGAKVAGSYIGFFHVSCTKLPPTQPAATNTKSAQSTLSPTGRPASSSPTSVTAPITREAPPSTSRVLQPVGPVLKGLTAKAATSGDVEVTIEGEGFVANQVTRVEIAGTSVPYRVVSPTQMVATVPQRVWTTVNRRAVSVAVTSGGQRISQQLAVR